MRVMNPGPGEIVDRLTVVARKIVESAKGSERRKQFEAEMSELFSAIGKNFGDIDATKNAYLLAATNAAIWQLEDELRSCRNEEEVNAEHVKTVAYRIQELNDSRAVFVATINNICGVFRVEK